MFSREPQHRAEPGLSNKRFISWFASLSRYNLIRYISLVSNQEVMNKYNELFDFLIPIIYEEKQGSWVDIREKADALLNSMRRDLGINDGDIVYKGKR